MLASIRQQIFWISLVPLLGAVFPALASAQQSDITRYTQEAQQALAKNDLEGARQALEQLAQLTPQVAEVFGNLGVVYYSENRFGQAAEALERALHLNPKLQNAELMLGVCDAELGRNEEAVRILEPLFRSPPDAQRGRLVGLELQRPYALLGEYAKADAVAEEMTRRYPDDPEILYDAAGLYTDRIYELLRRLVDVAPGSVWVHLAFAQSHESAKRYDAAIVDYRNALRLNRQLRGVHFNLGRDLLLNGDTEQHRREALEEFNQELALNPQSANTEYEIGEVYRREGKLEPAREHFSTALAYSEDFEDAQIGLARVLIGLNRPQEALAHLSVAVRLNARNEVSHFLLSEVYRSLGDTSRQAREIALFREYRAHPGDALLELTPQPTTPQITRQSLGSEASSLP